MEPIEIVEGTMVPLYRADIDTDQIMPKQFLKRVERTGFGEFVFFDWRDEPDFVLNDPRYADARILVSGPNFGSGSSREHAPWGLQQWGFGAVVAPSFADIFANNCAKVGLLTVVASEPVCRRLAALASDDPTVVARVDLRAQTVTAGDVEAAFEIDPSRRRRLLEGLDDIALTLREADAIAAYEARRPAWLPTTTAP